MTASYDFPYTLRILKTQSTLVDIPILPMKRLRPALTPRIAATLALIALPLISLAEGSAPADAPAPAENSPVINTLSLDTSLSGTPGSLNLSETREIDLWERIRGGFAIPDLENKTAAGQTTWYASRSDAFLKTLQRGSRYLYHVVEQLEKRGMPTELALLPFIESAFNPQAISSAKASGMWQFMAATGKDYNLKQNMFTDERRGVLDSTEAALNYLERLYGMFGDWQLALAAYNWGEGSVQRAIKKQQAAGLPIDFDSLSVHMPAETRNYVPKLQAVKNIIAHPEQFNISLPALENQPYFVPVAKTRDMDVKLAAELAELPLTEFTALNPQFNKPVITGTTTKILLPTENAEKFKENLTKWQGPLSTWATYIVQKTEKIEALAAKLGHSADFLRNVNLIPAKMLVKAGSTLLIPKSEKHADQDIAPEIAANAKLIVEKAIATRQISLKVGKRDNLNAIANRYHVSVADIKSWNKLKSEQISYGQTLKLEVPVTTRSRDNGKQKLASHHGHRRS